MLKKRVFRITVMLLLVLGGFAGGVTITKNLLIEQWDYIAPDRLFSAEPPLDIPTLQTIIGDAATDDQALQAITAYYDAHADQLAAQFRETNSTRLTALFVMYVTHISNAYSTLDHAPVDLIAYLHQPYSHCGTYSQFEAEILSAFGMTWRIINITGGTHAFVEVQVDGQWEIFDATTNDWIDTSAFAMERGAERHSRSFYTPLLDPQVTYDDEEVRRVGQELRVMLPGLGLFYFPKAPLFVYQELDTKTANINNT